MSQLLHPFSCPASKSELDIFHVPPTQVAIQESYDVEHRPLSTITDDGPFEFFIHGNDVDYIDFGNSYLYCKLKIVNLAGTDLVANAPVGPENLLLHTLWSQIDLLLNDQQVTSSSNTYAYRAYLETILSYGTDAKKTHLRLAMFEKDTATKMESQRADGNNGLNHRANQTERSRSVELIGRLHLDLCEQEKLLLNGVSAKLRLIRNTDQFCLHAADDATFRIKIEDISFFVRKVRVSPNIQLAHLQALHKGNAKYHLKRAVTKMFAVPQGNMQINKENLFLGQLPTRLVIGFIKNGAFHGKYELNPFNFQHFNATYVCLHVGGKTIPAKPLRLNFPLQHHARAYLMMLQSLGKTWQDEGNDITLTDFGNGYTLFVFDLSPDQCGDGDHAQLIKHGSLRLEVQFSEALNETINIVAHGEFNNLLEIDKHKNIMVDFAT